MDKETRSKKAAGKARFLRFCFAKGICKKGGNGKVKGINDANKETMIKALKGDKTAQKRLDFKGKSRGGVIFGDKRTAQAIKKRTKEEASQIRETYSKRAAIVGKIDRKRAAEIAKESRSISDREFRTYERENIKSVTNRLRENKNAALKRAKSDSERERINKQYQDDLKKELNKIRLEKSKDFAKSKALQRVNTDIGFIKQLAQPKRKRA